MEIQQTKKVRKFIEKYLNFYSQRDEVIKDLIDENFSGLDGISNTVYNQEAWFKAIDYDFAQVPEPFKIRITDFSIRWLSENIIQVITVSFWDIELFKDFPEFDKIRTVFILQTHKNSFKLIHQSNSVSLLSLDRDEVFPITFTKFLKSWKKSLFGLGKMHHLDSEE